MGTCDEDSKIRYEGPTPGEAALRKESERDAAELERKIRESFEIREIAHRQRVGMRP